MNGIENNGCAVFCGAAKMHKQLTRSGNCANGNRAKRRFAGRRRIQNDTRKVGFQLWCLNHIEQASQQTFFSISSCKSPGNGEFMLINQCKTSKRFRQNLGAQKFLKSRGLREKIFVWFLNQRSWRFSK